MAKHTLAQEFNGIPRMSERKNAMQRKLASWVLLLVVLTTSSIGIVSAQTESGTATTITLDAAGVTIDGDGAVVSDTSVLIVQPDDQRWQFRDHQF
jgi:hypothetical protein